MKVKDDLTQGNLAKALLLFTLPILLGNIIQQIYGITDSIVVGRILGEDALAAVGASMGINNIILSAAMGITLGIGIVISKLFGEGNINDIQKAVDTGILLSLLLSITVTAVGLLGSEFILKVFNVPDKIFLQANSYFKITFVGVVASFLYNALTNFLRSIGDSVSPLIFLVVSSLLNIVLDILFVKYMHFGVAGAAIATVISQIFVMIILIVYINKKNFCFKVRLIHLKFDYYILKKGLKIGIPTMLQQLFISLGSSVLQILINGFGSVYISAYTAASKIDGFATMPAVNMGKAMSSFIAQNEGARKPDRIKKGIKTSILIMTIISILISVIVFLFAKNLIGIFCDSQETIKYGENYLYITSGFYIIFSFMQLLNGILLGKGKASISMISTIVTFCCLQVPAAYFLSKTIGITGIWIAAPIGWIGGLLIRLGYYIWNEKKIFV